MNRHVCIKDIATLNSESFKIKDLPEQIRYLDTGNLTKNKIRSFHYINKHKDKIPSRAKRKVRLNTLLYSTVRPNQEHYGIIEGDFLDIVVSTGFTTIDIFDEEIYYKYIYYLLSQKNIIQYLHIIGMNAVSSYPAISSDDIGDLRFEIPNYSTQKAIAKVLSDLDTKIELNNRINVELESMAKTIYDYWFVQFDFPYDFDQGKPDVNGKPYKSSGGKMVYNEKLKREIPEGWEVKKLSEIANITMGQSPSGKSFNNTGEGEIFFQGSTDFGWRYPSVRQHTIEPKRMAKIGDILLSVRAPVGTLNIADNNCCIGRGLAALNSKDNATSYLFYVMLYFKQVFDFRNSSGTTFGGIIKDDLFSLNLVYPVIEHLIMYDKIVLKINNKVLSNHKQNQQLTALRDWLLPMLMNGQVTVGSEQIPMNLAAEPRAEYGKKS